MDSRTTQGFGRRTSDMLSAVLNQSDDCIMLLGAEDTFVYINPAGRQHLGIGASDGLNLDDWLAYWPVEGREEIKNVITQAKAGHSARVEVHYPDQTGAMRWCEVEAKPVSDAAEGEPHILIFASDITGLVSERLAEQARRVAAEREVELLDGVAREMRHRFKNQLAVISSLLRLSARHTTSVQELTNRFEQRLAALARAQDFLAVQHGGQLNAGEAIQQIMTASGAGERVTVTDWPDIMLSDDAVQQLALILGELQTNALKHGALTSDEGRITLSADLEDDRLSLLWVEENGVPVAPPTQPGGGLKLLERMGSLPGAKASVEWRETGCAVRFYVKVDR